MNIQKDHVIHLENGCFAGDSSRSELNRILAAALASNPASGLALHFHGGLVNEPTARGIADRLAPLYAESGHTYPLFFVWESGVIETLWNNLGDIRKESFFQELVKKVGEWVLKKLPGDITVKGSGGALIDEKQLRRDFDDWFSGVAQQPPGQLLAEAAGGRAKGAELDERHLAEQIEVALDPDFKNAVQEVYNGLNPQGQDQPATRGAGTRASAQSLLSPAAADALFERSPVKTKGLLSWAKVAKFVAKVVIACVKRFLGKRSHGFYPTVVEEVLRAAYGDKIGAFIWNSMKTDTADAFVPGDRTGGYALLDELATLAASGQAFKKITLIGHSTGAIYICNLLEVAAKQLPDQKFDVIFLAPAVTHDLFAQTLKQHRTRIAGFRQFGMQDEVECKDQMVKILYPRSLLYFVSGLLETEVDMPLVGMRRYLEQTGLFNAGDFPNVATVSGFLGAIPKSTAWSITDGAACEGMRTASEAHGDFDNDGPTLESVVHILSQGY